MNQPNRIEPDRLYTATSLGRIVGLPKKAIAKLIHDGELPASQPGRYFRIRGADWLEWHRRSCERHKPKRVTEEASSWAKERVAR